MDGGAWWAVVHGVALSRKDWATLLSLFTFMHWRRKWQPTPVFSCLENPRDGGAWWAAVYGVAQNQRGQDWCNLAAAAAAVLCRTLHFGDTQVNDHIACLVSEMCILAFPSNGASLMAQRLKRLPASASVCLQCGRPGIDPWVGKIPWRRKWQPTSLFLPGKSHGRRNL